MSEEITLPKDKVEEMLEQLQWLEALEDAGVDNWSGIDYAYELLRGYKEDE